MTKKLVIANLVSDDFNDLGFDLNQSMGSSELQKAFGVPKVEKITSPFEYSLIKRLKKDLHNLKLELCIATIDHRLTKTIVDRANKKFRLTKYIKFSSGQKLIISQYEVVRSAWFVGILFDKHKVTANYYDGKSRYPVLFHEFNNSEIKQSMRKEKLNEIYND